MANVAIMEDVNQNARQQEKASIFGILLLEHYYAFCLLSLYFKLDGVHVVTKRARQKLRDMQEKQYVL